MANLKPEPESEKEKLVQLIKFKKKFIMVI
jgi:hypothetical protein